MDVKATIKKLHEHMPNLSTDELITILDCYVEHEFYTYKTNTEPWIYNKQNGHFTGIKGIGGIEYSSSDKCTTSI